MDTSPIFTRALVYLAPTLWVLSVGSNGWTEGPQPGAPVKGLQAELKLERSVFSRDDTIDVRVRLRNTNAQPLEVFTKLTPVYNPCGEILFILETEQGKPVFVSHPEDKRPAPQPQDFTRLEPGQSVDVEAHLEPPIWWDVRPGRFRLKMQLNIYAKDTYDGTAMQPVSGAWTGTVVSNPVPIEVTK